MRWVRRFVGVGLGHLFTGLVTFGPRTYVQDYAIFSSNEDVSRASSDPISREYLPVRASREVGLVHRIGGVFRTGGLFFIVHLCASLPSVVGGAIVRWLPVEGTREFAVLREERDWRDCVSVVSWFHYQPRWWDVRPFATYRLDLAPDRFLR